MSNEVYYPEKKIIKDFLFDEGWFKYRDLIIIYKYSKRISCYEVTKRVAKRNASNGQVETICKMRPRSLCKLLFNSEDYHNGIQCV